MIRSSCFLLLTLIWFSVAQAQAIPSPKEHFGFNIGDDYQLANNLKQKDILKSWLRQNARSLWIWARQKKVANNGC